jgi:hypothetical protein
MVFLQSFAIHLRRMSSLAAYIIVELMDQDKQRITNFDLGRLS